MPITTATSKPSPTFCPCGGGGGRASQMYPLVLSSSSTGAGLEGGIFGWGGGAGAPSSLPGYLGGGVAGVRGGGGNGLLVGWFEGCRGGGLGAGLGKGVCVGVGAGVCVGAGAGRCVVVWVGASERVSHQLPRGVESPWRTPSQVRVPSEHLDLILVPFARLWRRRLRVRAGA